MQGSQSREFFIGVAAMIGYTITITEYRTFVVGIDRVGDSRLWRWVVRLILISANEWGKLIMNAVGDAPSKPSCELSGAGLYYWPGPGDQSLLLDRACARSRADMVSRHYVDRLASIGICALG